MTSRAPSFDGRAAMVRAWGREIGLTVALGLPMILGQTMHVMMHAIDAVMVGRLGVESLAAAAVGNNAAAVFYVIGVGLGSTVPVLAARAFGAGDRPRLNLVLRHGLTVSAAYGVGCVLVFALLERWVLAWFGAPEIAVAAGPYALLLIASLVPALLTQNLRGFAEAQNRPWLPLGNILLGVGINIVLNFGLIYGVGGWPGFGLPGAALGTLVARCAMLAHFVWVLRRSPAIAPRPDFWRPVVGAGTFYREYFRLAIPSALVGVVLIGNMVVVTAWMGRLGAVALAANEITRQVVLIMMTLPMALSWAIAIRVGQAVGRRDGEEVRRIAWSSVAVSSVITLVSGAMVMGWRGGVPSWFLGSVEGVRGDVAALTAQLLAVAALNIAADGAGMSCLGVYRGLAAVRGPAVLYASGLWLVGLPLGYVLGFGRDGGGVGVWTGLAVGNAALALALVALLVRSLSRWQAPALTAEAARRTA